MSDMSDVVPDATVPTPPGSRRQAAVLGSPIAHSLSPALHLAAYASLGLDWTYTAVEVDEQGLPGFFAGLDDTWAGLSLTMPLKECVIELLAVVDDEAMRLRSVNTVLPDPTGWRGTNTDVYGITEAVTRAGLQGVPRTATVLGSGATARSAVAALARLGAGSVVVCARRPEAATEVAELGQELGLSCRVQSLDPDPEAAAADVVISTLPGEAGADWQGVGAQATGVLLDASYHPWPTPLASTWGGSGIASGRDMLLWQAVEQVRLMTGREPAVAAMSAALPT